VRAKHFIGTLANSEPHVHRYSPSHIVLEDEALIRETVSNIGALPVLHTQLPVLYE